MMMEGMQLKISNDHSYFQVVNEDGRTSLKLVKGTTPFVVAEISEYLTRHEIPFNIMELSKVIPTVKDVKVVELCAKKTTPIREEVVVNVLKRQSVPSPKYK